MTLTNDVAIASDNHLEPYVWKGHPALAGDAYYALEQIVDRCLEKRVKALALLGDVFNVRTPDPRTVVVCYSQIERLHAAGIQVIYLQGQHELSRDTPWLEVHPWPLHVHKTLIEFTPGLVAYGLDWTPPGRVRAELAAVPAEANVLLCHQVWGDFHGSKIAHECDFSDVPGHIKILVTGDYHKHFTLNVRNRDNKPMIVGSPGSGCLQSISEDPSKAFFVLHEDGRLEDVALRTRDVYRYVLSSAADLAGLLLPHNVKNVCRPQSGVPASVAKNIVHVTYSEDVPDALERLEAIFGEKTHLFTVAVRPLPPTVVLEEEVRKAAAEAGLEGALGLTLGTEGQAYEDAVRLFRSQEPAAEIEAMWQEYLCDQERAAVGGGQGND